MARKKHKRPLSTKEQVVIGLSLVFFVLIVSTIMVVFFAMKPDIDAKNVMRAVATREANLTTISRVDTYNGQSTYYSVFGKNAQGEDRVVLIGQKDKDIHILALNSGISRKKAEKIAKEQGAEKTKTNLGFLEGRAVWEVASQTRYYLIDFQTGQFIKMEGI